MSGSPDIPPSTALETALPQAQAAFRAWTEARDPQARLVVFCHFDADGLSAGTLFVRGLRRMGFADVHVEVSRRGENAFFDDRAKRRLRSLEPAALVVTDLGVHARGVLPVVPTAYVDHHRPEGTPEGLIVSGYGWEPIPTSAWLAYALLEPLVEMDDLLWIAAVGVIGDLGDGAPWPRLSEAKKRYTAKWLKEAVVLLNAARRASAFDVETPLRLLLEGDGPKMLREGPGSDRLAAYRTEVNAAVAEARKAAPVFSGSEPFALVRMHSACQIHPLLAQQWRGRLPKYAVIAANTGYLPGVVAFSSRTKRTDLSLPAIYQAVDLPGHNDDFGHGHDQASGGHLPPAAFNRLLDALGFPAQTHVAEDAVDG